MPLGFLYDILCENVKIIHTHNNGVLVICGSHSVRLVTDEVWQEFFHFINSSKCHFLQYRAFDRHSRSCYFTVKLHVKLYIILFPFIIV